MIKDDIKRLKAKKELLEGSLKGINEAQINFLIRDLDKAYEELQNQRTEKAKKFENIEVKIRQKCVDYKMYTNDIPHDIDQIDLETVQTIIISLKDHIENIDKDLKKLNLLAYEKQILEEFYKTESEVKIEINNLDNFIAMIENKYSKAVLEIIKNKSLEELRALKKFSKEEYKKQEIIVNELHAQIDQNNKFIATHHNVDKEYFELNKIQDEIKMLNEKQTKYADVEYDLNCKYCVKNPLNLELKDIRANLQNKKEIINSIEQKYPLGIASLQHKYREIIYGLSKFLEKTKVEELKLTKLKAIYDEKKAYYQHKKEFMDYEGEIQDWKRKKNDLIGKSESRESVKRYHMLQKEKEIQANKLKERESTVKELEENNKIIFSHEIYHLMKKKMKYKREIDQLNDQLGSKKNERGRLENALKTLATNKKDLEETLDDLEIHEKYLTCVHKNGIPLTIMSAYLPLIEARINSLIGEFVDFTVILENNGDNIDIKVQKSNGKNIHFIFGGMESFILDLAFKIALSEIARLPKCNIIFIDEGLSVLDKEKITHIDVLFDFLREHFDNALIISHIEDIKQKISNKISIEKNPETGQSKIYLT